MHDIIVVGASAGGVEATAGLVKQLPADLPAALFVVVHFPAHAKSVLPYLLTRAGKLPAQHAVDGLEIEPGKIYIAPPDWHLVLEPGYMRLTRGPAENRYRPAIDPLFRSAALHYSSRVTGILLSGMLDDGTAGMQAIKWRGGVTICQEPAEASYADMPRNAIEQVGVDYVLTIQEIATMVTHLSHDDDRATPSESVLDQMNQETAIASLHWDTLTQQEPPGESSKLACPSCGGVLWEVQDGNLLRFRCRVGHAFSPFELLDSQGGQIENALWTALRALEERSALLERMIQRALKHGWDYSLQNMEAQRAETEERVTLLSDVLRSGGIAALMSVNGDPVNPGGSSEPNITDVAYEG